MPWTKEHYPNSMKNLDERVRDKAIDIANALLEENYEEGRAIPIAISQSKKWAENHPYDESREDIHVVPHPDGWAVRRENAQRASYVFDTKAEAHQRAIELSESDASYVILHDENGRIQNYEDITNDS